MSQQARNALAAATYAISQGNDNIGVITIMRVGGLATVDKNGEVTPQPPEFSASYSGTCTHEEASRVLEWSRAVLRTPDAQDSTVSSK